MPKVTKTGAVSSIVPSLELARWYQAYAKYTLHTDEPPSRYRYLGIHERNTPYELMLERHGERVDPANATIDETEAAIASWMPLLRKAGQLQEKADHLAQQANELDSQSGLRKQEAALLLVEADRLQEKSDHLAQQANELDSQSGLKQQEAALLLVEADRLQSLAGRLLGATRSILGRRLKASADKAKPPSSQGAAQLQQQAAQLQQQAAQLQQQAAQLQQQAAQLQQQAAQLVQDASALDSQSAPKRRESALILSEANSLRSRFTHLHGAVCLVLDHFARSNEPFTGWPPDRARGWAPVVGSHYRSAVTRMTDRFAAHRIWSEYTPQAILAAIQAKVEESQHTPVPWGGSNRWIFQGYLYKVDDGELCSNEELALLVFDAFDKERRSFERIKSRMASSTGAVRSRPRIPESVRIEVWRRDKGSCARCGKRENLEYDHIVPVSQGGGNTTRNIELLCENCNRSKGGNIA